MSITISPYLWSCRGSHCCFTLSSIIGLFVVSKLITLVVTDEISVVGIIAISVNVEVVAVEVVVLVEVRAVRVSKLFPPT